MRDCSRYVYCVATGGFRCASLSWSAWISSILHGGGQRSKAVIGWSYNLTNLKRNTRCPLASSPQARRSKQDGEAGCLSTSSSAAESQAAETSTYVAFLHLIKCGGTSLRQWFRNLEVEDPSWHFISDYSSGTCFQFDSSAGVAKCAGLDVQRDAVLQKYGDP